MNKAKSVGVIVARFQVAELHAGHRHLIDYVRERHALTLAILGKPDFPTPRNPLSFEMRNCMLKRSYPDVEVEAIADHPSDQAWSEALDRLIGQKYGDRPAVLYASRDSFLSAYSGRYETHLVPELVHVSGTECRKRIGSEGGESLDFRRGVIYAWQTRLAVTRPMVDIAVLKPEVRQVLLAGKSTDPDDKWRFIGGLVDPTDPSLEFAAKRETLEEAGDIEVDDFRYIGSRAVSDWRYKGTGEGGITTFFRAQFIFGGPRAADDIARLKWVPYADVMEHLIEDHAPLGEMLMKHLAAA